MISLIVLVVLTLLARAAGWLWAPLTSWHAATLVGLAGMFVFTAVSHFGSTRRDLVRMVPPAFPNPEGLVTLTGLLEFAGAVGLLLPTTRLYAGLGLTALLLAMLPANIHAARHGVQLNGRDATPLVLRVPMQLLYIAAALWVAL